MATTVRQLPRRDSATLQLHIELRGTKPKVWRRVLVPETITLAKLHLVIQAAFGWSDGHLHEFDVGGERIGPPDPDYDTFGEIRDERKVRLLSALRANEVATIDYVYDFGDNWRHRIKVEKKLEPMPKEMLPLCIAGANARPPEDCGGVYGYYEFVAAVSDPKHPDHAHMTEWIGRPWDVKAFDIERANSWLQDIKL